MIKFVKEQKKSQLKHYLVVLNTIRNILPGKDFLKIPPSGGITITSKSAKTAF